MKNFRFLSLFAFLALFAVSCKNDKTDDTKTDTATLTAEPVTVSPVPDTMHMISKDSNTVKPSEINSVSETAIKKAPKKEVTPSANTKKEETIDTRTKKTSRKGRIILASLKMMNMQDKMEADKEGIYNRAEIMPAYPGGENSLRTYIENHITYPQNALDNSKEGTVKISFAVDEQGRIYSPAVISPKLGYGLEEEAIRVVKQMPKWIPGQIKGSSVKTRFTLPISYKIE